MSHNKITRTVDDSVHKSPMIKDLPPLELLEDLYLKASLVQGANPSKRASALCKLIKKGSLQLIDVREDFELEICCLEGALHLPLSNFLPCLEEHLKNNLLDKNKTTVVYCHHGRRSASACQYLESIGFLELINLQGGIELWAEQLEPLMSRY